MATINLTNYDPKSSTLAEVKNHVASIKELIKTYNQIVDKPNWERSIQEDMNTMEFILEDFIANSPVEPDLEEEELVITEV